MSLATGGARLGEIADALDWARTPLGSIRSWPQSLRTATELCLASRFPIVIYWGPALVTIYNDAYAPILGSKHPWALGRPCREVWSEIWDVIGPMLTQVVETGIATWSDDMQLLLERRGYLEECYFSFSFTPVRTEEERVGGVFTAVIETTERVVGTRRLLTLRKLSQHVAEARTVEQACELAARALGHNTADLPFSVIYLPDGDSGQLRAMGSSGAIPPGAASPRAGGAGEGLDDALARVAAGGPAERVALRQGGRAHSDTSSPDAPLSAMVLPIMRAGQVTPYGVLLAGISPRRGLDESYRGFYDLLADGVTTAVANARAYEEERQRAEALAELDRAKTAFFSNVSHEFRTPLTLLLGPLEELLRDSLPERTRAELEVMRRNGRRLYRLVNALLDFSRIEAERIEAVYEPTDLAAVTAELAGSFRSAIEHAGLRLAVECPPLPEPVYVDREMWEKIVLNLLSNAFKFTLQGEIAVTLRPAGHDVELSVRDTGVGIPAHELPHIFERFHRVKGSLARTHEGAGIGLALARELVTLQRGSIRADSTEGQGTVLTVSMPRGSDHLPAGQIGVPRTLASTATSAQAYVDEASHWLPEDVVADAEPIRPHREADADGRPRPFIVCADDNADMRAYLQRLLDTRYDVEIVANGQAALRAVRRRIPDVIVSDVMMPGLDGLGLLRALREAPTTRLVPVVLLSARAGEEAQVEGLGSGADDYLVKPFSSRELLARIAAHLTLARMRRAVLRKEQAALVTIEASEAERRRISLELHDALGQQLTALVLGLKRVRDAAGADARIGRHLQRLQAMAAQVSRDLHHVALELRPGALDEHGLRTAVANYVEDWSQRHDVGADFQYVGSGVQRFPPHVETTIYRIVQEALTNIAKHAKATAVSVVLLRQGDEIVAIVEDNGCGFDAARAEDAPGAQPRLGLLGMRERATLVSGRCDVESHSGGTTVFARIPVSLAETRQ